MTTPCGCPSPGRRGIDERRLAPSRRGPAVAGQRPDRRRAVAGRPSRPAARHPLGHGGGRGVAHRNPPRDTGARHECRRVPGRHRHPLRLRHPERGPAGGHRDRHLRRASLRRADGRGPASVLPRARPHARRRRQRRLPHGGRLQPLRLRRGHAAAVLRAARDEWYLASARCRSALPRRQPRHLLGLPRRDCVVVCRGRHRQSRHPRGARGRSQGRVRRRRRPVRPCRQGRGGPGSRLAPPGLPRDLGHGHGTLREPAFQGRARGRLSHHCRCLRGEPRPPARCRRARRAQRDRRCVVLDRREHDAPDPVLPARVEQRPHPHRRRPAEPGGLPRRPALPRAQRAHPRRPGARLRGRGADLWHRSPGPAGRPAAPREGAGLDRRPGPDLPRRLPTLGRIHRQGGPRRGECSRDALGRCRDHRVRHRREHPEPGGDAATLARRLLGTEDDRLPQSAARGCAQ